ncbi:MAG: hypothetical protein IT167_01105 [Bryobacterales bacterium]|nr:hypothetical protein [Bryobacterales bacterium]
MLILLFLPFGALAAALLLARAHRRSAAVRWIAGGASLLSMATGAVLLWSIFRSTSSTAAIGILFLPLWMIAGGAIGAVLGFAAYKAARLREAVTVVRAASALALLGVALYAGAAGWRIRQFHADQQIKDPLVLKTRARAELSRHDYFLLSAIARNPHTSAETLLEIARDPDPGLHEKRPEWINMVDRDRLAVVRKVIRNPNSNVDALVAVSGSTNDYVLGDLAQDRRTPEPALRQIAARSRSYLVHWGLAANSSAPPDLLEKLPRSKDLYVAMGLAYNEATPAEILRELASHSDSLVRDRVALNKKTEMEVLEQLTRDGNTQVARRAATQYGSRGGR